jgi:purine-binding chemotaxis protein CheW
MSTTTPTASTAQSTELERQLVVFTLHGEQYGLPITSVREIIRYTPPKATGAAGRDTKGLICLRGHILPIVELATILGNHLEINDQTKILVVELTNGAVGLIVDTVDEVLQVEPDQIEPIPSADHTIGDQIAKIEDRLITIIDAQHALGNALAG